MFYPERWLPTDLNSKVERAINAGECSLRESVRNGSKHDGPRLALGYINVVFAAFASQACEAARQGQLTPRQVRKHVENFLPWLFRHAFNLAGVGTVYRERAPWRYGKFKDYADEKLRASQIWTDHLREREEGQVASSTLVSAAPSGPRHARRPGRVASPVLDVVGSLEGRAGWHVAEGGHRSDPGETQSQRARCAGLRSAYSV